MAIISHRIYFYTTDPPGTIQVPPDDLPHAWEWSNNIQNDWIGSLNSKGAILSAGVTGISVSADVGSVSTVVRNKIPLASEYLHYELIMDDAGSITVLNSFWRSYQLDASRCVLTYTGPGIPGANIYVQLTVDHAGGDGTNIDDANMERGPFYPEQSLGISEFEVETSTELCDEVDVTLPTEPAFTAFVSSTQTLVGTYTTIGICWAIAFDSLGNRYVAESDDTHNFIEKFDSSGTSLGEWWTDSSIAVGNPFGLSEDADDNIMVVAYLNSGQLELFRVDTTGTLIDQFDLESDGAGSAEITVDVDADGIVYYNEQSISDGSLNTYVRRYDPTTSHGCVVLKFPPINGTEQMLGAFRLLLGADGGIAIVRRYNQGSDASHIHYAVEVSFYTKNHSYTSGMFLTSGNTDIQVPDALCYGEKSDTFWVGWGGPTGDSSENILTRYSLSLALVTYDPADLHLQIISCTVEHGTGVDCISQFMGFVTLVGAT